MRGPKGEPGIPGKLSLSHQIHSHAYQSSPYDSTKLATEYSLAQCPKQILHAISTIVTLTVTVVITRAMI